MKEFGFQNWIFFGNTADENCNIESNKESKTDLLNIRFCFIIYFTRNNQNQSFIDKC